MPELIIAGTVLAAVLLVRAVCARLTATDRAAVANGWTVTKLRFGGRVYQDPRLDQLAAHRATQAVAVRTVHSGREAG